MKRQDGKLDDTVEQFLSEKVESPAMTVLQKLAASDAQLSWEERTALARWISFQEMRTPMQRGGFEEIAGTIIKKTMLMMARAPGAVEEGVEKLKEQGKDYGVTAEELRKGIEEDAFEIQINPVLSMDVMMQAEEFVPFFAEMKWTLVSAKEDMVFPTSDHPVTRHDPDPRSPYRFGFMSATVEFGLPVSKSKFLLIAHDFEREHQWTELVEQGKGEEAKKLRESVPVTNFKKLDGETTAKLREGIIRSAHGLSFVRMRVQSTPNCLANRLGHSECKLDKKMNGRELPLCDKYMVSMKWSSFGRSPFTPSL